VRIRIVSLLLGGIPFFAGCAAPGSAPGPGQPTVQGESMQRMLAEVDQVRAFVYGGGSRADAETAAGELVSWSKRMTDLFPPGQASTDYVDMTPARVRYAPIAMQREAEKLLAAVRTGKQSAVGDQLASTERNGCGACHLSNTH
jgi:hypothetical protein